MTITPTQPPAIVTITTTSDNQDGTIAEPGNTVTAVFTTDKAIVVNQSALSFITADNTAYDRIISTVPNATNQYISQLQVTSAMVEGRLRMSATLADDTGKKTDPIVRDIGVVISVPIVSPIDEPFVPPVPKHWRTSTSKALALLTQFSNVTQGSAQAKGMTNDQIVDDYRRSFPGIVGTFGIDGINTDFDFIFYDLYGICLQERPEVAADAVREGGIVIHPIASNRLVFDWVRLGFAYPEKKQRGAIGAFPAIGEVLECRRLVVAHKESWYQRTERRNHCFPGNTISTSNRQRTRLSPPLCDK